MLEQVRARSPRAQQPHGHRVSWTRTVLMKPFPSLSKTFRASTTSGSLIVFALAAEMKPSSASKFTVAPALPCISSTSASVGVKPSERSTVPSLPLCSSKTAGRHRVKTLKTLEGPRPSPRARDPQLWLRCTHLDRASTTIIKQGKGLLELLELVRAEVSPARQRAQRSVKS